MGNINLKYIEELEKRLPSQEYTICKTLKQPFSHTNSGSRKIMYGTQLEQTTQIINPEPPIISTGYEDKFGELSSNFIRAKNNYVVIDKISKFRHNPQIQYWLILLNTDNNQLTCLERISYNHITEFYGYLFNNDFLDNLAPGDGISKGSVIKKTTSYDEYNNRAEGLNLSILYNSGEDTKEDPVVISKSCAKKFLTPLIEKVEVKINDNDILLNLYGGDELNKYKTFPDIGEDVKNGILCAIRRELKDEEALFSQAWSRLKSIMMNDKKYLVDGKIIDIEVFCNNPEKLQGSMYNNQIKYYYDQSIEFANKFVNSVNALILNKDGTRNTLTMSYELQKMYRRCKDITEGKQFIHDKVFNNIIMNIYVQEEKPLIEGDKITDRHGGKGVVAKVLPDEMMPHYKRFGKFVPIDIKYNKSTCINRLNPGQLFELSLTHQTRELIEYIRTHKLTYDESFKLIYDFIRLVNPEQAEYLATLFKFHYEGSYVNYAEDYEVIGYNYDEEQFERDMYIESIIQDGFIRLSIRPMSSGINQDKIREIYHAFPFMNKHEDLLVPIKGSNGKYRMTLARRKVVIGHKYIFRLKQLAEEKFSVVSLAATNIRNENSKSRMSKTHNAKFASTPVKVYGEMESSTIMAHLGIDYMYPEFMLKSSSPKARRAHKKLLTGDPFEFEIDIDEDCTSQSAEIGQAYLKTIGLKYRFIKIEKFKKRPISMIPMTLTVPTRKRVMYILPEELKKDKEKAIEYVKKIQKRDLERKLGKAKMKTPMYFIPGKEEELKREREYNEKLKMLGINKDIKR